MKRANGNGSVIKLKGKRRRPFCARITVWEDTPNGRVQKRRVIGSYKTRPEAEAALYQYAQGFLETPESAIPTFGECFSEAMKTTARTAAKGSLVGYRVCFARLENLHGIRVDRVTPMLLQQTVDSLAPDYTLDSIRQTLAAASKAFAYAMRMRFIRDDPVKNVDLSLFSRQKRRERRIFTPSEIEALEARKEPIARQILVLIYTGMRKGEACSLRLSDVDLIERVIYVRKAKTAAGVRAIPIADRIIEDVRQMYSSSRSGYLFENAQHRPYPVTAFNRAFNAEMEALGMDHIPHETRHTFATLLYNAKVDDVATKAIIGHTDIATTHGIYTHESLANLREAISRLS